MHTYTGRNLERERTKVRGETREGEDREKRREREIG